MNKPNIQCVAAKGVILNSRREVLILQQSDPTITGHDQYHLPGGILELGESLRECVVREILEETGLTAKVIELLDVGEWRARRGEEYMQFAGVFFLCKAEGSSLVLQKSEIHRADWVSLDTLDDFDILEPSKSVIKDFLERKKA